MGWTEDVNILISILIYRHFKVEIVHCYKYLIICLICLNRINSQTGIHRWKYFHDFFLSNLLHFSSLVLYFQRLVMIVKNLMMS